MAISHLPRCTKPTDPDRAAAHSHHVDDGSLETAAPHGEPDASLEARAEALGEAICTKLGPGIIAPPRYFRDACIDLVRAVDASRPAVPEVDDDEPLTRGTRVRTVAHLTALFSPSLHPHRRSNALGKIVRRMTSGDIYYDVRHDDGTVAGYERSELIDLTADASRPGLTEEQARGGWFLAAAWARLAQARGGAMQAFDEDYEKTKNARGWLESIGVDVNANPPVVIPEALRASRGETGEPAKAPPVRHPHHDRHCMIYDGVGCSHEAGCEVEK